MKIRIFVVLLCYFIIACSEKLNIHLVADRISQAPLHPLLPLGIPAGIPGIDETRIFEVYAASGAGVAVLLNSSNELFSIEIPSGKKITDIFTNRLVNDVYLLKNVFLSPNGRVTAIALENDTVIFVDTETGKKLWELIDIDEFLGWLPGISVALVRNSKTSLISYIDFITSKVEPLAINPQILRWAVSIIRSQSQVLVGSHNIFSLVELKRTSTGIVAKVIKDFNSQKGVSSRTPTLMLNGKVIVFLLNSGDLQNIDLETGKETTWSTGNFMASHYAKMSENTLLMESFEPKFGGNKPWVFNIEQSTLSPVEPQTRTHGMIFELKGRTGFMRRGDYKLWFGDELKIGKPMPFNYWLERNRAKHDSVN